MADIIKGKIRMIRGRRGGRYPHCNSLLVDSGPRAVIDPGSDRHELRRLAAEGVGIVLLTHYHSDHLRDLKEFPGSEVRVHELEKQAVESWEGMAKLVWFPDEVRDPTWQKRKLREVGGWGWKVSGTFGHEEEIMIGDEKIEVIHTPGHTPGHCCFWFPEHKMLHSSDIDLTDFGPWYGNASSDVDDFLDSIRRLAGLNPEITVTGHELGVLEGDITERLYSYAAVIDKRHDMILNYLETPHTLEEIAHQGFIYGAYYSRDNSTHPQEWRMARHHLQSAVRRKQVWEEGGIFRLA